MTTYLNPLGMRRANYDKTPFVELQGDQHACWSGWSAIAEYLKEGVAQRSNGKLVIAVECYSGILHEEVQSELKGILNPDSFTVTEASVFKAASEIDQLVAPWLGGEDPIFGYMTRLEMSDFLDDELLEQCRNQLDIVQDGLHVIYGPGASLCGEYDLLIYADMPRWEGQLRQRRNEVDNLGVSNRELKASLQYKRSLFIDWRVCDKLKVESMERWDYVLDTTEKGAPKLITGDTLRSGLEKAASQPFRVVPFFDPGPWGGQWMKEVCDLPEGPPNYAWCFDCVPEENSLLLKVGGELVEIPSINLVLRHPKELLGEPVYGLCGAWFPIRFDFLDTMQGGNLSFQVHPLVDYAREHFGLAFTQDESYYMLDAGDDAVVYLGLKDGVDPEAMMRDLQRAQEDPSNGFDDAKHVAKWPAKKHDHFLIPAGTCHCSGANSMVLEISHTPYIFTFKLWDWNRLGLDGKPRPINLEKGKAVIQWDRTATWVEKHLVNQFEDMAQGDGWSEEKTGLYKSEYIETRRHWFTKAVPHDTRGESVHVLNLVQGAEAVVKSPSHAFEPFVVHYAETFIIPAAVGPYLIEPCGEAIGTECATLKALMRINP